MTSEDSRTAARKRFDGALDEIVSDAVADKKKWCVEVIQRMCGEARGACDSNAVTYLNRCRDALMSPKAKPEPPAEPMTIPIAVDALRAEWEGTEWLAVVNALAARIEAQARRDATLCFKTGCSDCGRLILESAGLK